MDRGKDKIMENTKSKVMSNLIWRFAERSGAQIVGFIVSIVLARILSPNDYGTVALITVFTTFFQVFVDSGLGNSLIQKKDSDDIDFSTVFYTNIVFCILLYIIIFFCAPLIANFYNNKELIALTRVLGITMPCFGTTKRTHKNACHLAAETGVTLKEISIKKAVLRHFADIGQSEDLHNITYENAQARERTQVLMDVANMKGGIVIGTGDLSELALGWCTYNADQMSMYGVNSSIPKTLVRYLVSWFAEDAERQKKTRLAHILEDILDTPVSPELLPPTHDGTISQKTENLVGPYELHDFFLYYVLRYGFSPKKIYAMAKQAFDKNYTDKAIKKWLVSFYSRFFSQQFKRSCMPDGAKVGTVSLSPRGDWRMPSDASAAIWLKEAEEL